MAGLVEIAAPLKFLCCAREQMLHEQKLRLHKSGLSASYQFVRGAANGVVSESRRSLITRRRCRKSHTGSAPAQTLASAAIQAPKLLAAPQREKRPFVVGAVKSRWAMTELWDKLAFDLDY